MNEKYTKIVYQSEPIGVDKIILYLTTFDIEAFKNDEQLEKIPTKTIAKQFEVPKKNLYENNVSAIGIQMNDYKERMFETLIEKFVVETYDKQLQEMKECIEYMKKIKIVPIKYSNVKNVTNCDDVHCQVVEGNITNCDTIYCNEIKGNVVNCDEIIYKKGSE